MAFLKLDEAILSSTVWLDREGRDIFIAAALKARPRVFGEPVPVYAPASTGPPIYTLPPGEYGFTESSGPGLVQLAGHNPADPEDWKAGLAALARLTDRDDHSRSPDFEGRRLARVEGGYIILNLMRYRAKDHTAAERKRRQRARDRDNRDTSRCHAVTPRDVTQGRRQKTEDRNVDVDVEALRAGLRSKVDQMEQLDPEKRSKPDLIRLCTGYERNGEEVPGTADLSRLSIPRLERSLADADGWIEQWERGGVQHEA